MAGVIGIQGELRHSDRGGDGVRGRVVSSGAGVVGEWVVLNSSTNAEVQNLKVRKGDTVDFVADCRSDESFDTYEWAPRIRYTKESLKEKGGAEVRTRWVAKDDFAGPQPPKSVTAEPWDLYAQALLLSNEFFFVD
ncbi:MAG: hypothetical protein FJ405_17025 [Verrucomicrobia bacterium]|nr:hypothetical protein [Verrucomicrobiota bacterium]